MAVQVLTEVQYRDLFAALGKFIADKKLQDVCVMEFEQGVIVNGSVVYEARDGTRRAQETFVLDAAELAKLMPKAPAKRGLFGR